MSVGGIRIGPEGGERLPRGPRAHRVLSEVPELEALELRFGPGFSVPLHMHDDHADCFYVLEGAVEVTLGDEVVRAEAGTWVTAPTGVLHGFRNAGEGELRMLNIHAPNVGFGEWLRSN